MIGINPLAPSIFHTNCDGNLYILPLLENLIIVVYKQAAADVFENITLTILKISFDECNY